jgi:hypothetical protein
LLFPNKAFIFVPFNVFLNPRERETERRTTPIEEGWEEDKAEINAMGCMGAIVESKRYV